MTDETYETLDEETLFLVSQTFKALGDPTRIRILHLWFEQELSVSNIAEKLDLNQSNVSHQLRFLNTFSKVEMVRRYSQDDEHVMKILQQSIDHATHH